MPCRLGTALRVARRAPIGGTKQARPDTPAPDSTGLVESSQGREESKLGREEENDKEREAILRTEGSGNLAGWVARTRPLSGPLSPRGPQPVLSKLRGSFAALNGSPEPEYRVRGS